MNKAAILVLALSVAVSCWSCQSQTNRPHAITVQGCIGQQDGHYVLTSDSKTTYVLTGDKKNNARALAGHEAVVRGQLVYNALTPGAPAKANSHPENQLDVATMQSVSNTCAEAK